MRIAVILRVTSSALASGRLAGEAECVETGRREVVRSHEELLSFLQNADPAAATARTAAAPVLADTTQGGPQ